MLPRSPLFLWIKTKIRDCNVCSHVFNILAQFRRLPKRSQTTAVIRPVTAACHPACVFSKQSCSILPSLFNDKYSTPRQQNSFCTRLSAHGVSAPTETPSSRDSKLHYKSSIACRFLVLIIIHSIHSTMRLLIYSTQSNTTLLNTMHVSRQFY